MMAPIPRLRDYTGPALLSYGFRPFFLFGSLYAGLAILAWLPMFYGELELSTAFAPRDWHVHEMLYGYLPAVITGFLLTAVPNWTGRMPLQGRPLLVLVLAWAAGRVAVTTSAWIGWEAAAVIDSAFLLLVAAAMAPRDHQGQELAQPQGPDRRSASCRRQHRLPHRGACPGRRRLRHPLRDRRHHDADHADRRAHHPELHPQLARAREPRPPAGLVRHASTWSPWSPPAPRSWPGLPLRTGASPARP